MQRACSASRSAGRRFSSVLGDAPHFRQGGLRRGAVPLRTDALGASALAPLALRIDLEELDPLGLVLGEPVDADDDRVAGLDG